MIIGALSSLMEGGRRNRSERRRELLEVAALPRLLREALSGQRATGQSTGGLLSGLMPSLGQSQQAITPAGGAGLEEADMRELLRRYIEEYMGLMGGMGGGARALPTAEKGPTLVAKPTMTTPEWLPKTTPSHKVTLVKG